jgi:hypothetical protein
MRAVHWAAVAWAVAATGCDRLPPVTEQTDAPARAPHTGELVLPPRAYADARVEGVPHVTQKPDFCGEACVEMALAKLGRRATQDEVFDASGLDPELGRGVYTAELVTAVKRLGLDPGPVWYALGDGPLGDELSTRFDALHADLARGVLSIVCMHYDGRPGASEHFRLVTGYDAARDEVIYNEPAVDDGTALRMPRRRFLELWPLGVGSSRAVVIRLRLAPVAGAPSIALTSSRAALVQRVREVKKQLGPEFTVLVEPPFVVAGDDRPEVVRRHARSTVRWTVDKLKADFFSKDPTSTLAIYLFRDEPSYRKNAFAITHEDPTTPYGFFTPKHGALIMNIATGGGTLVHEIVHPFVEANFPDSPAWFNEGLGSLYEQAADEDGHIVGLTNWRLQGLQAAIAHGRAPSFRVLTATSTREFYDEDEGVHYAEARYLLYYLQQRGLLVRYYKEFTAHHAEDPTGYATLERVLGRNDMDAFQREWAAFVTGLHFP